MSFFIWLVLLHVVLLTSWFVLSRGFEYLEVSSNSTGLFIAVGPFVFFSCNQYQYELYNKHFVEVQGFSTVESSFFDLNTPRRPTAIYLDDERPTPKGYKRCYWPDEVIKELKKGVIDLVSLDHDLGDDARGTGYDVLTWIEERVALDNYRPPLLKVHSANPAARQRMEQAIKQIYKLAEQNVQRRTV